MAADSGILVWRIPRRESSLGSQSGTAEHACPRAVLSIAKHLTAFLPVCSVSPSQSRIHSCIACSPVGPQHLAPWVPQKFWLLTDYAKASSMSASTLTWEPPRAAGGHEAWGSDELRVEGPRWGLGYRLETKAMN